MGSSMTAPRATRTNAPSASIAVLRATKAFSANEAYLPRCCAAAAGFEAFGQTLRAVQQMSVDEEQLNRALVRSGVDPGQILTPRRERGARDGCHIGEAPFFIVRVGKTEGGEARKGGIAQGLQPRGRGRLIGEVLQPRAGLFRNGRHTLPTASGSSQRSA